MALGVIHKWCILVLWKSSHIIFTLIYSTILSFFNLLWCLSRKISWIATVRISHILFLLISLFLVFFIFGLYRIFRVFVFRSQVGIYVSGFYMLHICSCHICHLFHTSSKIPPHHFFYHVAPTIYLKWYCVSLYSCIESSLYPIFPYPHIICLHQGLLPVYFLTNPQKVERHKYQG